MTPCESTKPPQALNSAPTLDMNQISQNNNFCTNQFQFTNPFLPNSSQSPNVPSFAESDPNLPFQFQSMPTPSFHGMHPQNQHYFNHNNAAFQCTQNCCNDLGFGQYNVHPFGSNNNAQFPPYFSQNTINNNSNSNSNNNNNDNFFYDGNISMQPTPNRNRSMSASVICHAPGRARYGAMNCITSSDLTQKDDDNAVEDGDSSKIIKSTADETKKAKDKETSQPASNKEQYVYNSNGDVIGVLEAMNIVAVNGQFNIMRPIKVKQNKKEPPKKKETAKKKKVEPEKKPTIKTITRSTMKKGRHISAAEKLFVCKECGKGYKYLCNYRSHCKIHTDEAFVCSYCGKRFGRKSNYKEHVRIHTGEAPYKCKYCDRTFKQHHGWKDHMRVHTGEKPYQCSICKKRFTVGHNLNVHMRIHTGERPYSCKLCDKTFRQKSAYNSHQKQVHGVKAERSTDKNLQTID